MKTQYFLILICLFSCNKMDKILQNSINQNNIKLSMQAKKTWHNKDIVLDSIPGISLDRAYQELIKNKKGKEIIVAVIDTQLDIHHKDLKNNIWINKNEVPNNNIDDDDNGYIDDINGWNFLGINKDSTIFNENYECVRIIRKYKSKFYNEDKNKINTSDKEEYKLYHKAKKKYKSKLNDLNSELEYINFLVETFPKSVSALKKIFPKENYSVKQLDSLYQKISKNNKELGDLVFFMSDYKKYNLSDKWINNYKNNVYRRKDSLLNLDFDSRNFINDDINDITDIGYGNNNVNKYSKYFYHATEVTGLILLKRNNNGVSEIVNNIKVMPLTISCAGDEYDKDIALAIRYAVDNGAKVINLSFYKTLSLNPDWIKESIIYAKNKNVLLIAGSGNNGMPVLSKYPNDTDSNGKEYTDNFINVGASSYHLDKNLLSNFSNYSKTNVDLFAPGEEVYTTSPNNEYKYDSGTSLSTPIVSGIAALIMSYYPKLKAHQVKEILLASGVSYDIDVEITDENGKKKLVPFSSLSKSGKIVNAYNALLYAKNYKKWKAGKWPK